VPVPVEVISTTQFAELYPPNNFDQRKAVPKMFKSIIRKRITRALTIIISLILLLQLTPIAYADENGGSDPTGSTTKTSDGKAMYNGWTTANLAIFLTVDPNFIMDNDELNVNSAKLTSGNLNLPETPEWQAKFQNLVGNGISVNKLYAQVFRRTYISWGDDMVTGSVILTGKVFTNNGISRNIKSLSRGIGSASVAVDPEHSAATQNLASDYVNTPTRPERYGNPGKGVFKDEILTYLKAYFNGEAATSNNPDSFIQRLVDEGVADSTGKQQPVIHTWAYIAGGIGASMNLNGNGAAERCTASPSTHTLGAYVPGTPADSTQDYPIYYAKNPRSTPTGIYRGIYGFLCK
jgi:hypothetical protein